MKQHKATFRSIKLQQNLKLNKYKINIQELESNIRSVLKVLENILQAVQSYTK